jgi:hypothetical protein
MASTYSSLKIELITTGEQSATWGTTTNVNLGTALEEAIVGSADVTFASANVTLTLTDTNGTQAARNLRLRLTGTTGGARNLIVPAIEKFYIVQNDTADTITIKNSTGTGVAIPTTMTALVYNDGTNIASASVYSTSVVTPLLAATDASFVNALPITSGGTGVTTATGTGSVVRATSPVLVTPALGTPASGNLANCTFPTLNQNTTGNAATATVLQTARNIGGVSFNGSADINLPGVNTAGNQNTTGTSGAIANSGGWNVTPSGTNLYFNYNGTNVGVLTSAGNFTVLGNVTAFGTV